MSRSLSWPACWPGNSSLPGEGWRPPSGAGGECESRGRGRVVRSPGRPPGAGTRAVRHAAAEVDRGPFGGPVQPLGEEPEGVATGDAGPHGPEHPADEAVRHVPVEGAGHAVHEYRARLAPPDRPLEAARLELHHAGRQFAARHSHPPRVWAEPEHAAVSASGRDLVAAGGRGPGLAGPIDRRGAHGPSAEAFRAAKPCPASTAIAATL